MESLIKSQHAQRQVARPEKASGLVTSSDDNHMLRLIQHTHSPDAREVEVRVLLVLVEDILYRATLDSEDVSKLPPREDKLQQSHLMNVLDSISYVVDRVACEISYRSLSGADAHEITIAVFDLLTSFHWDGKLVLTLAAFALNYGEFWLLVQFYSKDQLAKSLAMLKLVPVHNRMTLQTQSKMLNNLIREMMSVAGCIVELRDLPDTYITPEVPELARTIATIPIAVYWTIRSVVACVTHINMMSPMAHELTDTPTDSWELSMLANKLKTIHEHLSQTLSSCHHHIEEKKSEEALKLLYELFETTHLDNMKVLRALIYPKDDIAPLQDCSTGRKVHLDVLRRKSVLLLISDLDISRDELTALEKIYRDLRTPLGRVHKDAHTPYEVVWIPIVDPIEDYDRLENLQQKFEDIRATMPWYSVDSPKIIKRHVVKFIKGRWHFLSKPILVVLDQQGNEASLNALHMMWIWGGEAFPFTRVREEELWRGESWKLNLIVDQIDPTLSGWINQGTFIFLYGGEDTEWIRRFTKAARSTAVDAGIRLEMAYVGKRHHHRHERIRKITDAIMSENLSYHLRAPDTMWFFWTRLESMFYSKIQLGKADDQDEVMQGIKKILSYDKLGSWALLSKGPEIVMIAHGAIEKTVSFYERWKPDVGPKGYGGAMHDYHRSLIRNDGQPCSHFDFHITARSGRIPNSMQCSECGRNMEKYITFSCCHEDKILEDENYNF